MDLIPREPWMPHIFILLYIWCIFDSETLLKTYFHFIHQRHHKSITWIYLINIWLCTLTTYYSLFWSLSSLARHTRQKIITFFKISPRVQSDTRVRVNDDRAFIFSWTIPLCFARPQCDCHTNQRTRLLFLFHIRTCSLFSVLLILCSGPVRTREIRQLPFDRNSAGPSVCRSPARRRPGAHQKRFSQSRTDSEGERFFHFLRCDTNLLPLALPRQLALKLFRSYSSPSR